MFGCAGQSQRIAMLPPLAVQRIVGGGASLICVFWLEKELNANAVAADGCGFCIIAIFSSR